MLNCSIITIGDELLIGQVIDTNSAWIAQQLNKAGIAVSRRVAVGDKWDDIWHALDEESKEADVVLITGGLGPTADDITKPLLCKYFNGTMIVSEAALENVKYLFEKVFRRDITERNLKQAEVPDTCTVINNKRGTAPGMWFEKAGKIFVSMPGVPHEMKGMMENDVIPLLIQKFKVAQIHHRTLMTFGIGESMLADLVAGLENALPPYIKLAYLPNYGMVRLRLTAISEKIKNLEEELDEIFYRFQEKVKPYLVTNLDEKMEEVVGKLLMRKQKKVCTAESCTGGYIAHLLTSIPGSSAFYDGSIVSYSYKAKEDLLAVNGRALIENGAVSEEIVLQMAKGALEKIGADYTIAVSGIMGPGGGTAEKPTGTVWLAAGNRDKLLTRKMHFRYERTTNIQLTAVQALNLLREVLVEMGENE